MPGLNLGFPRARLMPLMRRCMACRITCLSIQFQHCGMNCIIAPRFEDVFQQCANLRGLAVEPLRCGSRLLSLKQSRASLFCRGATSRPPELVTPRSGPHRHEVSQRRL